MFVFERIRLNACVHGLAAACLFIAAGCSDEQHTTGTAAEKAPGAEAAEKKSMDAMRAMMKTGEVKGIDKSK